MSFVCLSIPDWRTGGESSAEGADEEGPRADQVRELTAALLAAAPHIAADAWGLIWVDARGLSLRRVARAVLEIARTRGFAAARVGAARTAIAAEVAAQYAQHDGRHPRERGGPEPYRETLDSRLRGNDGDEAAEATSAPVAVASDAITIVRPGGDRRFLAPLSLTVLAPTHETSPQLAAALADVGVAKCGDLARLTHEAIEVRFGAECVSLWRLARADDRRRIFGATPRSLPAASLAWEEYALRDTERLLFVANRLVGSICAELRSWGEAAREMTLTLSLVDRTTVERSLRAARGTASRAMWLRLVRADLERITLPGAVVGLALRVEAAGGAETPQGDLFDRGFQTAQAVEEALAQLVDDQRATIVGLTTSGHPLLERRATWRAREMAEVVRGLEAGQIPGTRRGRVREGGWAGMEARQNGAKRNGVMPHQVDIEPILPLGGGPPRTENLPAGLADRGLVLQLLPSPCRVAVATLTKRGHQLPARYHELDAPADIEILTAAGPDRVSGGDEVGAPYAREYFHCLTADGVLVLLYRDAIADAWYLHGWWD